MTEIIEQGLGGPTVVSSRLHDSRLQETWRSMGRGLALEPCAGEGDYRVGGVISTKQNSWAMRCMWRDCAIDNGATIALPDGTLASSGARS